MAREVTSEISKRVNRKHGMDGTPIYKTWTSLRSRCRDANRHDYHNYGGRGITVCDRWNRQPDGFSNFYADMGDKPTPLHSVERRDNNGPYSPENCYWGTDEQQGNNRRTNRLMTVNGNTLTVTLMAKKHGLSPATVFSRLWKGASDQDAVRPISPRYANMAKRQPKPR